MYYADNAKSKSDPDTAYLTYSKHFEKAVNHLEKILKFTGDSYSLSFDPIELDLIEINGKSLSYFKYKRISQF